MELGRNQYVVSLELGIFQGRPKSIRPNSETVKIRSMAQEADSTHFFRPISVHPPSAWVRKFARNTCRCGKLVEENGHHGLSCARSAGRFSRHHNLNTLVKQALSSIKVLSILEPYGLTRTDGKRPDGITLAPWGEGKQLVWDVTCVDLLTPSRIENGSVANPGTAAEDA